MVHRLREVVAQVGFTRFEAAAPDVNGDLDLDVQRAPLARDADWLPAIENRGEGVFLQFKPEAIESWLARPIVIDRRDALITSANFTEAAQVRNIEVGLRVYYRPLVERLFNYFDGLIATGELRQCPLI